MNASYEKINYSVRPAKNIERKMLCDVFRKLYIFGSFDTYRYLGFGSTYFADFTLIHKTLGIEKMISIEKRMESNQRFIFNRPYNCIEILFGDSNSLLPALDWNIKTIAWLDYDYQLNRNILTDIKQFISSAISGSVIAITVNAKMGKNGLIENVGKERIPGNFEENYDASDEWAMAKICRQIIDNEISETLSERNGALQEGNRYIYKQLFYFHYADGVKMLTVGGLLYQEHQLGLVESCQFDVVPFVRCNDSCYLLSPPNLTLREIRYLDRYLPLSENNTISETHDIPQKDIETYSQLYRYFPVFAESEL